MRMEKRLLAGGLWYLSTLSGYSFAALILGVPREVGPIIALVVALLVAIDPAGLIWAAPGPHAPTLDAREPRPAHAQVLEASASASD